MAKEQNSTSTQFYLISRFCYCFTMVKVVLFMLTYNLNLIKIENNINFKAIAAAILIGPEILTILTNYISMGTVKRKILLTLLMTMEFAAFAAIAIFIVYNYRLNIENMISEM